MCLSRRECRDPRERRVTKCFLCVGDEAPHALRMERGGSIFGDTRLTFSPRDITYTISSGFTFRISICDSNCRQPPRIKQKLSARRDIDISPFHVLGTFGQERFICNCGGFSQDIRDAITTAGGLYGSI